MRIMETLRRLLGGSRQETELGLSSQGDRRVDFEKRQAMAQKAELDARVEALMRRRQIRAHAFEEGRDGT